MMRLGDTKTLAGQRRRIPLADRALDEILRIPHTSTIRAKLAMNDPQTDGEFQHRALLEALEDAEERDAMVAARRPDCWCFGHGGTGERAVLVPGGEVPMVLSVYCVCADADARRGADDQAKAAARAFADKQRVQSIWDAAKVPERFNGCTLSSFPVTTRSMSIVVQRIRNWLETSEWALVLHGSFGVGKSGLGIGALRLASERRQVGLFVKAPDLLTKMRATYGKNADVTEFDVLESLRTVPLLMVDDIGADRQTDWATALLFQVLDARHDEGRKTIVTTNLDIPGLSLHLGERTMHRFEEGAVFLNVDGPNLRKGNPVLSNGRKTDQ